MRTPALALVLVATAASAQNVQRARQDRGTIVLTDANRASASFQVYSNDIGLRGQSFVLAPTVDVFVTRGVTLGAAFGLDYEHYSFAHSLSVGGDGRLGFYGVLAGRWAVWPTVALGASRYSSTFPDDDRARLLLRARLDVPVLYYPAPGFFVGLGPVAGLNVVKRSNAWGNDYDPAVTVGLLTMLGGTF